MTDFRTNEALGRFEVLDADTVMSFATYRVHDDLLTIDHVETLPEGRGRGLADQVMTHVVDVARERGLQIDPQCPVAASFMERHGNGETRTMGEVDPDSPARGVLFPEESAPEPNEPA